MSPKSRGTSRPIESAESPSPASNLICTQDQWFPLTIEDVIITQLLSNLTLVIQQNVLTPCFFQSLTFSLKLL